jgi:hypothetical protein
MSPDFWWGYLSALLFILFTMLAVDLATYVLSRVKKRRVTFSISTTHGTTPTQEDET